MSQNILQLYPDKTEIVMQIKQMPPSAGSLVEHIHKIFEKSWCEV